MNQRDSQNQTIDRAVSNATRAVPQRNAITQMAQSSNIAGTGALPPQTRRAKRPLLAGVTLIGDGVLFGD